MVSYVSYPIDVKKKIGMMNVRWPDAIHPHIYSDQLWLLCYMLCGNKVYELYFDYLCTLKKSFIRLYRFANDEHVQTNKTGVI